MDMMTATNEIRDAVGIINQVISKIANTLAEFVIDKGGNITNNTKDDIKKLLDPVPDNLIVPILVKAVAIIGSNVAPSSYDGGGSSRSRRGKGGTKKDSAPSWLGSRL